MLYTPHHLHVLSSIRFPCATPPTGLDRQSCDVFKQQWCDGVDDSEGQCTALYPGCGWFSRFGAGSGDVVNKNVERLWLYRYHVAAELVRRGVNTLMSDLDGAYRR